MKYLALILALLFVLTGCSPAHPPIPKEDEPGARKEYWPKKSSSVIQSTDIIDFECEFFGAQYGMMYDHCHFTAKKEAGAVSCVAEGTRWVDDAPFYVEFTADLAMLTDLQTIVADKELAKNNGFYGHTNGLPYGIGGSLSIEYASGEKLTMSDNSGAPFPCAPFRELFERYAEEAGYLFLVDGRIYTPDDWADALAGWWVYMGEDADVEGPEMYLFTNDNKVYVSPGLYNEYLYGEVGFDIHDEWFLKDGKPIYRENPDDEEYMRECRIALTDETHMQLIDNEYGNIRHFAKNSAPEAVAFLEQSPYYYLADYGSRLCYVRLGEYFGEGDFLIETKAAVLVSAGDDALIEEYGLENAPFDDGYELVAPDDEWYSALHLEGETEYSVVDLEADDPASTLRTVTSGEFVEIISERGEMLAYVREEEAVILTLEEFYGS